MNPEREAIRYAEKIRMATRFASNILIGCEARLNTKAAHIFNGRTGYIEGVMPDAKHGLTVLVMLESKRRKGGVLNSRPATRTYWPLVDVVITGKRKTPCTRSD